MKVKGKALLIMVAAILVLGGVGAGAYVFGARKTGGDKATMGGPQKAGAAKKRAEGGVSVSIGKITTNLADKPVNRYIQVEVELVVEGQAEGGKERGKGGGFDAHVGKARDAVLRTLRSKTSDELSGEDGMIKLRKEIRDRVNESLGQEMVADVFFKDFVIQ